MNNERNQTFGQIERRDEGRGQLNGAYSSSDFPYGQMGGNVQGDLRVTPRLDTSTLPRRKCDGSLRENNVNTTSNHGWGLKGHPLAMVYSPYQHWQNTYSPDVALGRGTLFTELDLPLEAVNCRKGC